MMPDWLTFILVYTVMPFSVAFVASWVIGMAAWAVFGGKG